MPMPLWEFAAHVYAIVGVITFLGYYHHYADDPFVGGPSLFSFALLNALLWPALTLLGVLELGRIISSWIGRKSRGH
jgi:hypothetical protein